ncbi:hypothetical protein BJV78DRAFT_160812 [Lactifluus subvellereus]|nr:hypothetical protein BJV78DRAFT_160812 [Lactifluus subvellereus]
MAAAAVTIETSPSLSQAKSKDESPKDLFDYPDADIILRSRDSQEFRVLRMYITKSSPVLGELIQAASSPSDTPVSADAGTPLPAVQLPDSGALLSTLLTFIFPVPPVLPLTVEETMELLSVAQKYEMSHVLAHIRRCVSLLDPPFIRPENALRVYFLAQKYGLHREAARAARITIQFSLTIEDLEDKLDVMPSPFLYELWKYHQGVRTHLISDINHFRKSGVCDTLKGLNCVSHASSGIPHWIDGYIGSIIETPSSFDPTVFQMVLARHVGTYRCSCMNIPVETIRTFWTDLAAVVYGCMEKAESALCIIGGKTHPQVHSASPRGAPPLPECLDISEADVLVQSSDHANFHVHKSILASSSQFFKDMFSLPQPPDGEVVDGLPVVHVSENAELVRALITMLYPIPSQIPVSYDETLALLAAAQKYDMSAAISTIRAEVSHRKFPAPVGVQAFRAYAIASRHRLIPEMDSAARHTLDYPMTFEYLGSELELFEGWALRDLACFRRLCRDKQVSCLESFLDVRSGPSKIWVGCVPPKDVQHPNALSYRHKTRQSADEAKKDEPTLPSWLHGLFSKQIGELRQSFTNALIKPSSIREGYLTVLQSHVTQNDCTFCLKVHALKGDEYRRELFERLTEARTIRVPHSLSSSFGVRSCALSVGTDDRDV